MRCLGFRVSAVVVFAGFCWGQTDAQKLTDQARALPPEFAADLLFRFPKAEVLEDIYTLAGSVHNPIQLDDVVGWTDTDSWSVSRALALHLDTLSIQCRVVKLMFAIDPARARQMFLDIPLPKIDAPKCDAALVPDPSIYFETAALFNLERPVRAISSALELPSAAKAIHTQFLIDIYAALLADLSDSPRATGFALTGMQLPELIVKMAEGNSADGLLAAYRKFLVRYASGERCADTKIQPVIDSFNERLRWGGYLASNDLPKISENEAKPGSVGGRPHVNQYWRSEPAKRLLSAVRHLRFGDGSTPVTADQKASDDWQTEAKALLTSLENWKADDAFHERAILYSSFLELLPAGSLHEAAAQGALGFLADSSVKSSSPLEWLLELNGLMNLKQPEIAKAMLASKDPTILLYGTVTYQK